jgi:hypothetical protein
MPSQALLKIVHFGKLFQQICKSKAEKNCQWGFEFCYEASPGASINYVIVSTAASFWSISTVQVPALPKTAAMPSRISLL